jgi:hypothetical protein
VITDDELIRLLELADPARVDDPAPVLEPAEYRDALLTNWTPVTLVDRELTPTQPTSGHRWPILISAAAVVAIAFVVIRDADDVTPADEPAPTVTVPPRALPTTPDTVALLAPGTYFVDEVDGTPTPRISATIGDGWWHGGDRGWEMEKRPAFPDSEDPPEGSIGAMVISRGITAVYSDACHRENGYHAGSVETLDGLVAALTEQQGWAEMTAPSDITIDGYAGKAFQRTAPAVFSDCDLVLSNSQDDVQSWNPSFASFDTENYTVGYAAGSIETVWVLDIEGTPVIIRTVVTPGPSAGSPDFAADVLDSIRIERA